MPASPAESPFLVAKRKYGDAWKSMSAEDKQSAIASVQVSLDFASSPSGAQEKELPSDHSDDHTVVKLEPSKQRPIPKRSSLSMLPHAVKSTRISIDLDANEEYVFVIDSSPTG